MKKNKNIKIIIGIIIGVILSGITSYAVARTLINSKDVIYTDNSKLNASNVQAAIDGTCSKIDTRLSEIEDKLYTVNNIHVESYITPQANFSYTGISIKVSANSYCSLSGVAHYNHHKPYVVSLNSSPTTPNHDLSILEYGTQSEPSYLSTTYSFYTNNEMTIYLWVKYEFKQNVSSTELVYIDGFCATKYKQ